MKATILAAVVLAFSVNQAFAVSRAVKIACRADYFAHCSMHAVGSPGVRKCMRDVGPNLSTQCIGALIAAGEVGGMKTAKKTYAAKKVVVAKTMSKKSYTKLASAKSKKKMASKAAKKRYAKKPSKYVRVAEHD